MNDDKTKNEKKLEKCNLLHRAADDIESVCYYFLTFVRNLCIERKRRALHVPAAAGFNIMGSVRAAGCGRQEKEPNEWNLKMAVSKTEGESEETRIT